jgi:hypothetical protein
VLRVDEFRRLQAQRDLYVTALMAVGVILGGVIGVIPSQRWRRRAAFALALYSLGACGYAAVSAGIWP